MKFFTFLIFVMLLWPVHARSMELFSLVVYYASTHQLVEGKRIIPLVTYEPTDSKQIRFFKDNINEEWSQSLTKLAIDNETRLCIMKSYQSSYNRIKKNYPREVLKILSCFHKRITSDFNFKVYKYINSELIARIIHLLTELHFTTNIILVHLLDYNSAHFKEELISSLSKMEKKAFKWSIEFLQQELKPILSVTEETLGEELDHAYKLAKL